MLESKKGKLTLFVSHTKLLNYAHVALSFPVKLDGCTLQKLSGGKSCSDGCFPVNSEETIVAYALYEKVKQALCGSPVAVAACKSSEIKCCVANGSFGISWLVNGSGSAVRKSIGVALKQLNPGSCYPIYQRHIKTLERKSSRENFDYAADRVYAGMNSGILIGVVGKVSIVDKKKIDDMLEVLVKKWNASAITGTKSKPTDHTPCDLSNSVVVNAKGFDAVALYSYLAEKSMGTSVTATDSGLLLNIKLAQWNTLKGNLKDKVADYVKAKWSPKVDLPQLIAWLGLSNNIITSRDIYEAQSRATTSSMGSALTKHL
jgi:hypothetical protein